MWERNSRWVQIAYLGIFSHNISITIKMRLSTPIIRRIYEGILSPLFRVLIPELIWNERKRTSNDVREIQVIERTKEPSRFERWNQFSFESLAFRRWTAESPQAAETFSRDRQLFSSSGERRTGKVPRVFMNEVKQNSNK